MLIINNLSKIYRTGKQALKHIDLSIEKGEFTAILGPNGAGKTTLINILAGNVVKSAGKVLISDYDLDIHHLETKKLIGIVPQELSFDSFFTVNEVLNFHSGYFGIKNNQKYIDELLRAFKLESQKHVNTRALSGGMKRRLAICKALIHKPKLFILDEPTAGVDIELRHALYDYLKQIHRSGVTILLTTHYLEEAQYLCKRIIILNQGRIVAADSTSNLLKSLGDHIYLQFEFTANFKDDYFNFFNEFSPNFKNNVLTLTASRLKVAHIFNELSRRKLNFINFSVQETKLEDVFLKLTKV